MATPKPIHDLDERLPLLLGFQPVAENTAAATRFIDRGRGIYVYDTDGREYIEATASFYVAALGYQNEELIDAIKSQYDELPFFVSAINRTPKAALDLAERLVEVVPVHDPHIVFAATGSEANDFLIKMLRFGAVARGEPARTTIIGRHGSYHGGTLASASLTGGHHEEFGLPIEGFRHVAQPDYHGERLPGERVDEFCARLAADLRRLIDSEPEASVAAFVAEPISFSAGFKVPPADYFPALKAVLDHYAIDFVVDEVVTGFGRTGALFGSHTLELEPAHVTLGKALTSGYFPMSAIALGRDLYNDLEAGSERCGTLAHAATFAAHPVGAAAALKTLEIIERDGLVARAARTGEHLATALGRLAEHPLVGDVRCVGLAGCLDFLCRDGTDVTVNDDADAIAAAVNAALLARGVVGRAAGRSVLLAPPLITTIAEVDLMVERLAQALDDVLEEHR